MFERRDLFRSSYLFFVILTIMFTLSQIFVVHRKHHSRIKNENNALDLQAIIRQLESSISTMMKSKHLSLKDNIQDINAYIYAEKIKRTIRKLRNMEKQPKSGIIATTKCLKRRYIQGNTRRLQFMKSKVSHTGRGAKCDTAYQCQQTRNKMIWTSCKLSGFNQSDLGDRTKGLQRIATDFCPSVPLEEQSTEKQQINQTASPRNNSQFGDIRPGGIWKPSTCVARQRTAIIIPYRDRHKHLELLLLFLIPVLKRQFIDFRIFVIEQHGNKTFNKGRLMNAGFKEAWAYGEFDCFVFHDVDMVPENDKNMYTCHDKYPRHMSPAVDKFKYRLPYPMLVGGVLSMRPELFLLVNGYSNLYWGWGAEDDDMAVRFKQQRLVVLRPPAPIGRYKMIKHDRRETIPVKTRVYLLKTVAARYQKDGLNTVDYSIVRVDNCKLYTHVVVDIGDPPDDVNTFATIMP